MSLSTVFYLFVLPVLLAGGAWIAVLLNERADHRRPHPGE
jgi:hypothetical protein